MDTEKLQISDLLLNESFQRFVMQNSEADTIFWSQWLKDNPEGASVFDEAKEIISFTQKNKLLRKNKDLENEVFKDILNRIEFDKKNGEGKIIRINKSIIFKVAALFIILIGIGFLLKIGIKSFSNLTKADQFVEIQVAKGQFKTLYLPDSSQVWLNSGSKLVYPVHFKPGSRKVQLTGEAYFKVKHNEASPFTVNASNRFFVKVLGTEFNINCYQGARSYEATLFKGKVAIYLPDNDSQITVLKPSQKAQISTNPGINKISTTSISEDELDIIQCWKENSLTFKNETFENIAKYLERFYNTKIFITSSELMHERFTGSCNKEENILDVLDIFKRTESIDYTVKNGNLIIFKNNTQSK